MKQMKHLLTAICYWVKGSILEVKKKKNFPTSDALPSVLISHKSVLREQHERGNWVSIYISSQVRSSFVNFFGLELLRLKDCCRHRGNQPRNGSFWIAPWNCESLIQKKKKYIYIYIYIQGRGNVLCDLSLPLNLWDQNMRKFTWTCHCQISVFSPYFLTVLGPNMCL